MAIPVFRLLEPKALDASLTTFLFLSYPSFNPLANPACQLYSQMIYCSNDAALPLRLPWSEPSSLSPGLLKQHPYGSSSCFHHCPSLSSPHHPIEPQVRVGYFSAQTLSVAPVSLRVKAQDPMMAHKSHDWPPAKSHSSHTGLLAVSWTEHTHFCLRTFVLIVLPPESIVAPSLLSAQTSKNSVDHLI